MPNFSLGKGWLTKTGGDLNTGGDLLWRLGAKRGSVFIFIYREMTFARPEATTLAGWAFEGHNLGKKKQSLFQKARPE